MPFGIDPDENTYLRQRNADLEAARDVLAAALRQLYFGSGLQADWEVAKAVLDRHAPGWRKPNK